MSELLKTQLGRLRIIAFVEGTSFLVILFITMPLKYGMDMGGPNKIFGMAHGVFFILYVLAVMLIREEQGWGLKNTALALIASVIPFGTFWADKKIFTKSVNTPQS